MLSSAAETRTAQCEDVTPSSGSAAHLVARATDPRVRTALGSDGECRQSHGSVSCARKRLSKYMGAGLG